MAFNPNKPFKTLNRFDEKKPFEKLGFDPNKNFENIETDVRAVVSPSRIGEYNYQNTRALTEDEILRLINSQIRNIPLREKVIERIIEKPGIDLKNKEPNEYQSKIKELENKIREFEERFDNMGGSGVIGIPSPEGHQGQVLTTDGNQIYWTISTGGTDDGDHLVLEDGTGTTTDNILLETGDNILLETGDLLLMEA